MDPFVERFEVPVEAGRLLVGRAGPAPGGDTPVVVAAHGITGNHLSWGPVARALDGRSCLLALDLRGRAASAAVGPPFGIASHADDVIAVLEHVGVEHAVITGHSMGAWVAALAARRRPERAAAVVLVDGGIAVPMPDGADPDDVLAAVLGPALARLHLTFPDPQAYRDWWRQHPAFASIAGEDVDDADLARYVDHDLTGAPPDLRSSVIEEAVRVDGTQLLLDAEVRHAIDGLECHVTLLRAPRGLLDEPTPFIPEQAAEGLTRRQRPVSVISVGGTNHYTLLLSQHGAAAVAGAVEAAIGSEILR
ncbi:MAG: alpha/beta fold hydrolase [Acidimicrobiales bacterium]